MTEHRIIVIGGGAAGLMAAGHAAEQGAKTLVLEKMKTPARKLRITGKGRCNLTNVAPLSDFISHLRPDGRFLYQAFSRFFTCDLVTFFEGLGVPTLTERGGRVFPISGRAQDVADALMRWAYQRGVKIQTGTRVERLIVDNGRVVGVYAGKTYKANNVIVTTGGASYPATGSTGDGYGLAKSAGHRIVPIRPSLVPLETAGDIASRLQDLTLRNVNVRVYIDGKKQAQAFGEMFFTDFGISGPVVLSLSRLVVDALGLGRKVDFSIDLKPSLDDRKLDLRLLRDLNAHGKQQFRTLLKGLLPRKLIPICVELTNIALDKTGHQITSLERKRLRTWLKDFRLKVTGHRPFTEAIITAGGVDTREVNPDTMGSRLMPGLYFAGEILDLDGDTGGYNLQTAFSTGRLAGQSAAQRG